MPMEFKTGVEGSADFAEMEFTACPVTGRPVATEVCRRGPGAADQPCAYFLDLEELERGAGKDPKRVLICGAPRALPTVVAFFPREQDKK